MQKPINRIDTEKRRGCAEKTSGIYGEPRYTRTLLRREFQDTTLTGFHDAETRLTWRLRIFGIRAKGN